MPLKTESRLFIRKVNRRIAEIRKEKGFTQAQIAEMMEVDLRQYQRCETERCITLGTLFRLKEALKCDVCEFFKEPTTGKDKRGRPRKNN
jgi:transcriptional regulator with XRE-family HTH domain